MATKWEKEKVKHLAWQYLLKLTNWAVHARLQRLDRPFTRRSVCLLFQVYTQRSTQAPKTSCVPPVARTCQYRASLPSTTAEPERICGACG